MRPANDARFGIAGRASFGFAPARILEVVFRHGSYRSVVLQSVAPLTAYWGGPRRIPVRRECGELPTLGCAEFKFECRYAPDYVGTAWRFAIYAMTIGVGDHAHDAASLALMTGSKVSSRALRKRDDTERPLPLPASNGSSSVVGFASSIKPTTGR